MANSTEERPLLTEPRRATAFRMARRSLLSRGRGRGRGRTAVVRLGGRRRWSGRLHLLGVVLLRRLRLRWLAVQYRRLRAYYAGLLRDMAEAAAAAESVRARVVMDSYYAALPVATTTF